MQTDPNEAFDQDLSRYTKEWMEFLAIPSISTDPDRGADCTRCAQWLVDHTAAMGFDARLLETPSKPVVYAEHVGRADKPVVLFYGHYDVQPVDPLDEWQTPPFEPDLRNGRMYARGAQDNKGQVFYALKAMEWLLRNNALDVTVKVLLEGEEESGSQGLSARMHDWAPQLKADVLMVCDTGTVPSGAPTIIMGLRGIVHASISLSGPLHDLHSGIHGGVAPNPAAAMARLIAGLHDNDGRIAVKDFSRDVSPPTERERALANTPPHDAAAYGSATGVPPVAGDRAFTPPERAGFQPSIDVNGIHSGFGGDGVKTIIPAQAIARLTARLAPGQNPDAALAALVAHLEQHAPEGLRLDITDKGVGGPGFRLDPDSALVAKARQVLDTLTEHQTALLWEGASIPVVSGLAVVAGAGPLLVGFGHDEDRIHAPNESFSVEQFKLGYKYVARMLAAL